MANGQRNRGSIIDAVTLEPIWFQYEPVTKMRESTSYGSQKIIGRRLVNRVWVGTGTGEIKVSFTLVGAAYTQLTPTASEVGQFRYNQAVTANVEKPKTWVPDKLDSNGHVVERGYYESNPYYNPKMLSIGDGVLIENPGYKGPAGITVEQAKKDIQRQRKNVNALVSLKLKAFRQFLDPQLDTGAPHPIYLNMGNEYDGRKFIVTEMESQVTVTNYATLEPTEAVVTLTLAEIPAVVVTPEPIVSSTAMTGRGSKSSLVKLPSMQSCHKTSVKAKARRR